MNVKVGDTIQHKKSGRVLKVDLTWCGWWKDNGMELKDSDWKKIGGDVDE